jgi:hypothetical protein
MDYLGLGSDFSALSIGDLVKARDEFHLHLLHKANVVGTAIGRYRIRKADPDSRDSSSAGSRGSSGGVRTLQNSEVRPNSWPAILVFVNQWRDAQAFGSGGRLSHEDFIPSAVYASDGRKVPICVIKVDLAEVQQSWAAQYTFPTNLIGGGFPLIADVQGEEHIASVGCLVSDGHRTFALTNRHAAGEAGSRVSAIIGNNKVEIGTTWMKSLTRAPFTSIYGQWPGKNIYVDLDAALIDVDDVNDWTTNIYGIGQIGRLADLGPDNLSLRLIGCPVKAFGAASRQMAGEIAALFYRFKSIGGFEYVADFLIGPRAGGTSLGTHPGDSGTIWLLDAPDGDPQPIAMQWGGQEFLGDGPAQASSYALATMLSTICNKLDVDLVRGFNIDQVNYWGAVGHYGIAYEAIDHLPPGSPLQKLMTANLERITYQIADDTEKNAKGLSTRDFVPLADVPDMVWKVGAHKRGGMKAPEHANHFADMDRRLKNPLPQGATLLEICKGQANVTVDIWRKYYDQVKKDFPDEEESRGLLPFRCWQIFDAMVYFLKNRQMPKLLCAAGILSHYVGDACQPLHISYLFNGDPDRKVPGKVRNPDGPGTIKGEVPYGTGCHSAYEDKMVDYHVEELWPAVAKQLKTISGGVLPASGQEAAKEVVRLMQSTFDAIKPMDIVNAYGGAHGLKPKAMADKLWGDFGEDTVNIMADGADCLARLWQGALKASGVTLQPKDLAEIDEADLAKIYQDPTFLQSESLDTIAAVLATGNGGADGSVPIKRTGSGKPATTKKAAPKAKKKAAKKKAKKR